MSRRRSNFLNSIDNLDDRLRAIAGDSTIVRAASRPIALARLAWTQSSSRRTVMQAAERWTLLTPVRRIQMAALTVIVAMVVHMLLRGFAARSFEPLTFVVPAVLAVASTLIYILAPFLRRQWERIR